MSVSTHRAQRSPRPRRWRAASAVLATAALTLVSAGIAMADDVAVDSDVVHPGVQHSIDVTVAPGDPVSATAQMVVKAAQNDKHLAAGSDITVGLDSGSTTYGGVTGVSVGDATGKVPDSWDTGSADFTLSSEVSFTAPITAGTYQLVIHYIATHYTCVADDYKCLSAGTGDPFIINLTVATPAVTNTTPVVAYTNAPTPANEGDTKTFDFSITDPDASDTHSFASGYPSCGTGNVLVSSSIDQGADTGTFTCTFPDGLIPAVASTVKVRVADNAPSTSNEAPTQVTVYNVTPSVSAPAFASADVDCQSSVTLGNISFSDPGADANWTVAIAWGDGNTDSFPASAMGAQASQSHTYTTGGNFTATVTVTDKDGAHASNTSSNTVTVHQYAVDFLPPFDDSSPSGLIVNKMKNGRVVPVKAMIYDKCAGSYVTDPTAAVTIKVAKTSGTGGTSDPVEEYADAGLSSGNSSAFRWSTDGFWIYNLDSKALGLVVNNNYRIDIFLGTTKVTADDWAVLQPVK